MVAVKRSTRTSCQERAAAPVGSVFSSPIVAVASGLATMNP